MYYNKNWWEGMLAAFTAWFDRWYLVLTPAFTCSWVDSIKGIFAFSSSSHPLEGPHVILWYPMSACLWKIPRNARKTNVLGKIAGCPRLTERVMGTLRPIGWSHVEVLGLMVSFCRVFAATVRAPVLVRVSNVMTKHHRQKQLEEGRV